MRYGRPMKKSALLVIDMQLVAFDGQITPPINAGDVVLANVARAISNCRAQEIAVVYVQTCAVKGQPYAQDQPGW